MRLSARALVCPRHLDAPEGAVCGRACACVLVGHLDAPEGAGVGVEAALVCVCVLCVCVWGGP